MTKILIYTDFDGTITGKEGLDTVESDFYQSLLEGYQFGVPQNYKYTPLIGDSEKVLALFEAKFGKYDINFDETQPDTNMLMSRDAIQFFKELLKNPDVNIIIVTKNRSDYIKILFQYHGFSESEINKLKIDANGYKHMAVYNDLEQREHTEHKASYIYILDDKKSDYDQMVEAAEDKQYGYAPEQIKKYNETPGNFKWSEYLKDIQNILAPQPIITTPPVTQLNSSASIHDSSEEGPDIAAATPEIQPVPAVLSTTQRTLTITSASIAAGLIIGFWIGLALVATGVFAPFGTGILGALALATLSTLSTGLLTGVIGFSVAKGTESQAAPPSNQSALITADSPNHLSKLGGISTQSPDSSPVKNFPNVLGKSNKGENPITEEPDLESAKKFN